MGFHTFDITGYWRCLPLNFNVRFSKSWPRASSETPPVVGRTSTTPSSTLNTTPTLHSLFTHFAMYQSLSLCMTTTALRNVFLHTFCFRMLRCGCECRLTMLTDVEKSCTSGRVWCELPALPHLDSPPLLCVHTDSLTQIPPSDATHLVTCGRATKSYKESRLRSINASAPAAEAHFFLSTFSALRSEDRLEMEPPLLHPRGWKSTPAAGGQRNSSIKPWV